MRTVWKYDLQMTAVQVIVMPTGATPVAVNVQRSFPRLWAIVDPESETPGRERTFRIVGTGHPEVQESDRYIGTFFTQDGDFVWHVFEVIT
jgi:hypothetical protein